MLKVETLYASSASASAAYYTRYLTDAPGEQPGVWAGRQAAGLGLSGEVTTDALQTLLEGRDPVTGSRLGYELRDRTVADGREIKAVSGFDATFSAPKSLSTLWALTGDPGLLEAHDIAVTAAVEHLERFGSTTRVRADGRRLHPDTPRVDDGDVPPDDVTQGRPPGAHPRRDLGEGANVGWSLVGVGRPLLETASTDVGRAVPVGAARRAHTPLRGGVGADRHRTGRDRRHAQRPARRPVEAQRRHRRRDEREARQFPRPHGPPVDQGRARRDGLRGGGRHPAPQVRQRCRRPAITVAARGREPRLEPGRRGRARQPGGPGTGWRARRQGDCRRRGGGVVGVGVDVVSR